MSQLTAKDIMVTKILQVSPGDTVSQAIDAMNSVNTGSVLVVENGTVAGIFTERDVLKFSQKENFLQSPVSEYMTKNPVTVESSMKLSDLYNKFSQVSFRHFPIVDHGKPVGMISNRDLLKVWADFLRNEKEQLTHEYERAMSIVVHDLRSPISATKSINELLLMGEDPGTYLEGGFPQLVDESCNTMLQLINDLLEISTIKSGDVTLEKEPTDLAELAQSAIRSLAPMAANKSIQIEFLCNGDLPQLPIDQRRMSQALYNLISNAIKYSDPGLPVTVAIQQHDQTLELSVVDRGQGISEEEQDKVFDEMCKISSQPTAGEASTGLGLSITKKLVTAHGGQIRVSSTPFEKTEFVVTLPLPVHSIAA